MVKIFFSYATKDSDKYRISELARLLERKAGIKRVFYWEQHATGSIIEYMNENVKVSNSCVFFYSPAAAASEPVKMERDMAVYQGKHVIPVFTDINDVPEILKIQAGVNAADKTAKTIASEIYRLVAEKHGLQPAESIDDVKTDAEDAGDREVVIKGTVDEAIPRVMETIGYLQERYQQDSIFYRQIADRTGLALQVIDRVLFRLMDDNKLKGRPDHAGTPGLEDDKLVLEENWHVEREELDEKLERTRNLQQQWETEHGKVTAGLAGTGTDREELQELEKNIHLLEKLEGKWQGLVRELKHQECITEVADRKDEAVIEQEKMLGEVGEKRKRLQEKLGQELAESEKRHQEEKEQREKKQYHEYRQELEKLHGTQQETSKRIMEHEKELGGITNVDEENIRRIEEMMANWTGLEEKWTSYNRQWEEFNKLQKPSGKLMTGIDSRTIEKLVEDRERMMDSMRTLDEKTREKQTELEKHKADPERIVEYRGMKLRQGDVKALETLEKQLGEKIPEVKEIKWSTFGMIVEGKTITELGLFMKGLTTLPESFGNLRNLEKLYLRQNKLKSLPKSFGNLTKLEQLDLHNNKLAVIPESLQKLTNLQILELSINGIKSLPESFGELRNLETLYLYGNQLTVLPEFFGQLNNLKSLYLSNNQLKTLSESFGELKSLEKLLLSNNKLTELPESLLELTNLRTLDLGANGIATLSESFGNLINLRELSLWSNKFVALPKSFKNFSNLKKLDLRNINLDRKSLKLVKSLQKKGCEVSFEVNLKDL